MYTLTTFLFIGFALLFLGSAVGITVQLYQDWKAAETFAGLNELVEQPSQPDTAPTEPVPTDHATQPSEIPGSTEDSTEEPQVLARYQKVYEMNSDLFGWISVDGISFSYPVMHTPEEEERYLRRGFDGSYSRSGVPFLDADCTIGCGNYIIYGHNLNNGTMFEPLIAYREEDFWKAHPVICFDTLYERGEYEVISAFYSRVFYKYEKNVFRYYAYDDLTDSEVFTEYVENVLAMSIYDTGAEVQYGDQLITLITCSYGFDTERFVVVARKRL